MFRFADGVAVLEACEYDLQAAVNLTNMVWK